MKKGYVVDESMSIIMSNLTSTTSSTSEISASSGTRNDTITGSLYPHHQDYSSTSTNLHQESPQPKKKRSLPGHPDPDAEVVSLSPKTLMATNRFICEICNKGFQRDQNLQLHRRGHNLPWKLKQRNNNNKELIKKKVYVCPEPSCVHHEPSRALGDLTGIKKHFFRKHGEKKWKCDKCPKRYAVQSDWKAHSKVCGTRDYKCDCGTIFSRRDSFITHRAFCDALAQESVIKSNITTTMNHNPPFLHDLHHTNSLLQSSPSIKTEQEHDDHIHHYFNTNNNNSPWLLASPMVTPLDFTSSSSQPQGPPILPTQLDHPNSTTNLLIPNNSYSNSSPHISATALLQKASQIRATMSKTTSSQPPHVMHHQGHVLHDHDDGNCAKGYYYYSSSSNFSTTMVPLLSYGSNKNKDVINEIDHHVESSTTPFHDVVMNMGGDNYNNDSIVEELVTNSSQEFGRRSNYKGANTTIGEGANNDDEMTRDFLGITAFSQRELFNISVLDHHLGSSPSYGKQNQR